MGVEAEEKGTGADLGCLLLKDSLVFHVHRYAQKDLAFLITTEAATHINIYVLGKFTFQSTGYPLSNLHLKTNQLINF